MLCFNALGATIGAAIGSLTSVCIERFSGAKKRTQIISLQDGTRIAKWNSYQIAASAWPLKA
jgi:gas vesicle protein